MRCYKKCVAGEGKPEIDGSHYHCNYCLTIRKRSDGFKNHLRKHITCKAGSTNEDDSRQADETEAGSTNEHNEQTENPSVDWRDENDHPDSLFNDNSSRWRCGQCNKDFASKKSLQNHTRFYHISPDYICATRFLGGICVDPERGIYMIRRSFSGTNHPVHVMHNFGVDGRFSCELNDCRELSSTAKRTGNPKFMCNHLKSVQYVAKSSSSRYILPREPLEALINKKVAWFKREREEECLKLQENAVQDNAPIIAEFSYSHLASTRYRHFSVNEGKVHHYSRFKRVIVTYDINQHKWGCSCCRTRANCVHKCVSKWFMYVERPDDLLLPDNDDLEQEYSDQELEEFINDTES